MTSGVRFPALPDELAELVGGPSLVLCPGPRALLLASLDLEPSRTSKPPLARLELGIRTLARVTRHEGGGTVGEDLLWQLPLQTRLHALVLIGLELAPDHRDWVASCPRSGCDAELELELPLEQLARSAEDAGPPAAIGAESRGRSVRLRHPSSDDARRWHATDAGPREMLRDLLELEPPAATDAEAEAADVRLEEIDEVLATGRAGLETALAEADPLVDFRLAGRCPVCGGDMEVEVDLETAILHNLRAAQGELFGEVGRLASHYHWPESELLRMPGWRRRRYLSHIDREASWAT